MRSPGQLEPCRRSFALPAILSTSRAGRERHRKEKLTPPTPGVAPRRARHKFHLLWQGRIDLTTTLPDIRELRLAGDAMLHAPSLGPYEFQSNLLSVGPHRIPTRQSQREWPGLFAGQLH